jgi:hypothetical protein
MKLRSSPLAPYFASMVVFLIQTSLIQISTTQASAQSSPDSPPHSMQQDSQPPSLASSLNKGGKKITGCIRSDNGKYVLESKLHKKVWLSGPEDFAPHAGHTVTLSGTYLNGSVPANGGRADQKKSSDPPANPQESNFQVTKVEMVSDTCAVKNREMKASDQP